MLLERVWVVNRYYQKKLLQLSCNLRKSSENLMKSHRNDIDKRFCQLFIAQNIKYRGQNMAQGKEFCEFCQILKDHHQNEDPTQLSVLKEDDQFFSFFDHDPSADIHILICTKQHIETVLQILDPEKLKRMKQFAINTIHDLIGRPKDKIQESVKLCFHIPPHVSVYHVHLHCLLGNFTNLDKDKRIFGHMAVGVDKLIQKLQTKQSKQKNEKKTQVDKVTKQKIVPKPKL